MTIVKEKKTVKTFNGKLKGKTPKDKRNHLVVEYFTPVCKEIFANEPEAKAIYLAVGSFWSDQGDSDTYARVLISSKKTAWKNLFNKNHNSLAEKYKYHHSYDPDYDSSKYSDVDLDQTNINHYGEYGNKDVLSIRDIEGKLFGERFWLDDGDTMIEAFQSYAPPNCDQEMGEALSFAPYAVATLDEQGEIQISVIGIPDSFGN